ncbi:hypothetical protein D3C81_2214020 [compost metagenome]
MYERNELLEAQSVRLRPIALRGQILIIVECGLELIFSLDRAQCITEQFESRNHRAKGAAKAHFALSDI